MKPHLELGYSKIKTVVVMEIMLRVENKKNNIKKEYAKKYLLKYIKELKVHFDMNDNEIKDIMREVYYSKTKLYFLIRKIKKYFKEKQWK